MAKLELWNSIKVSSYKINTQHRGFVATGWIFARYTAFSLRSCCLQQRSQCRHSCSAVSCTQKPSGLILSWQVPGSSRVLITVHRGKKPQLQIWLLKKFCWFLPQNKTLKSFSCLQVISLSPSLNQVLFQVSLSMKSLLCCLVTDLPNILQNLTIIWLADLLSS